MALSVSIVGASPELARVFYKQGFILDSRPERADVLLFIDGFDVDPVLYRQEKAHKLVNTNLADDTRDLSAWRFAPTKQLKVGVGRGAHFLNVMNAGSLFQHVGGHDKPHSMVNCLTNEEVTVTSAHHQLMVPGPGAEILGYSKDVGDLFIGNNGEATRHPEYESEIIWYEGSNSLCFQPRPDFDGVGDCRELFFNMIASVK